jgi:preprotein translocase subunit SecA
MRKKLSRLLEKVRSYSRTMANLSDADLQKKTEEFRRRLAVRETTDSLLPEAYALVCEADKRILGLAPFDEQVLGAIAMHLGYLTEMNTGEGKTLTATMPLYLNALTGKSSILVTANDYLARRDADEMGPVYRFLGMTVRAGVSEGDQGQDLEWKKANYAADILYTTHSVLGFDYLMEHLVRRPEDRFLRDFYFIIIDEADSVLLDAAQTPLIISGAPRVQSNLYAMTDQFTKTLRPEEDFEEEDQDIWLTEEGNHYAETYFDIPMLYSRKYYEIYRHLNLALRANQKMEKEKDYVVSPFGEIVLLDNGSGRLMEGMRLQGGLQQAVEEKEGVPLSQEQRAMASITYQNLFLMFPKMCGMSGTMYDARKELWEVYHKHVVRIPPHKPNRRVDLPDVFFRTSEEEFQAAIEDCRKRHDKGQPVLIVTSIIRDTEKISQALLQLGIPHNVLNANNSHWEADIIRNSGQKGAVTVSTGIAGRGTDIRLGKGVSELGGLAVIGVGRMENVRLERQARGRSGRQGDPGCSRFYVSLEDETIQKNIGEEEEDRLLKKNWSGSRIRRFINNVQKDMSFRAVQARKQAVEYDKVLKRQREVFYQARTRLLDREMVSEDSLKHLTSDNIRSFLKSFDRHGPSQWEMNRFALDNLSYRIDEDRIHVLTSRRRMYQQLIDYCQDLYQAKLKSLPDGIEVDDYIREAVFLAIDQVWIEEVDFLQQLQYATMARSSAQLNPLYEYQKEALRAFREMEAEMKLQIMRNILLGEPYLNSNGKLAMYLP